MPDFLGFWRSFGKISWVVFGATLSSCFGGGILKPIIPKRIGVFLLVTTSLPLKGSSETSTNSGSDPDFNLPKVVLIFSFAVCRSKSPASIRYILLAT